MKEKIKKIAGNIYIYIYILPQGLQRFLDGRRKLLKDFLLSFLGEEVQVCSSRLVPRDEIG